MPNCGVRSGSVVVRHEAEGMEDGQTTCAFYNSGRTQHDVATTAQGGHVIRLLKSGANNCSKAV